MLFLKLRAVLANRELIDSPHELKEANFRRRQDLSRLQSQDIADSDLALFLLVLCVVLLFRVSFFCAALLHTRSDGKNKA